MKDRIFIADLRAYLGQPVLLQGWVQAVRDQKRMQFLILRDPTGAVQVTNEKARHPDLAERIGKAAPESVVTIWGEVLENSSVRFGGLEIWLDRLEVENRAETPLPLDPFAEGLPELDYRLDWRFLDLRRPQNLLLFKIQTTALAAMRQHWAENGFIEIHSPKLMGSPSESGAELFSLEYFGRTAYLAQSPQFYKQMAMAAGFERVFEVGPVFRADPSFTSRHMTEFTSIDVEISWIDTHEEVMAYQERWLQYVIQQVKEKHGTEIQSHFGVDIDLPELPFPRLSMAKVHAMLEEAGYNLPPDKKDEIDPGGERLIGKIVKEKWGCDFAFITDWPVSVRPFYHMRHPGHPDLTRSYDLIANGLEITTGAQREHRYEVLVGQAQEKGLNLDPIHFYLDFFRYGCPPHGGFAVGLERLLMVLLGLPNVREAVYLFRGPSRLYP